MRREEIRAPLKTPAWEAISLSDVIDFAHSETFLPKLFLVTDRCDLNLRQAM